MKLLHRIGPRISSNWNTIDEILAHNGPISFDGVYTEVYEHYKALKGKSVSFFVMGKYVGGDNSFDKGETPGRYCTWPQIFEMAGYLNAIIGYHGWAHKRCAGLTRAELFEEMCPPEAIAMGAFAWPHGVCDETAIEVAKEIGYLGAWCAGHHGDDTLFQLKRSYLNW